MTRFDFMEKIGFFMVGKTGGTWTGHLSKSEQIEAFGVYLGKGLLTVDETDMTVVHEIRVAFGYESEINKSISTNGYSDKHNRLTPLSEIPGS